MVTKKKRERKKLHMNLKYAGRIKPFQMQQTGQKKKKKSLKVLYETIQSSTFKFQPRNYRRELDVTTSFSHNINM